jgi:RDD family
MVWRFNPAPGWPPAPPGFVPPPGWRPDPSWPPAPPGWRFWVWVQDAADIPPAPDRQPTDHKPADEAAEAAIQAEPIEQVTADEPRDLARLAPHPRRLVAFLVDWAGVALSFGAAALLGELQAPDLAQFTLVTVAVAFGIALAVVPGLSVWLTGGQTIGKALFGLTERRIDGARPKATLGGLA